MTCHFEKMKEESCGVYSLSKTFDVEATVNVYSIASTESERSDRESSNRAPNIFRFAPSRHRRESVGDTSSEERRVGKACVSKCRSRWSPYHYKTNHVIYIV